MRPKARSFPLRRLRAQHLPARRLQEQNFPFRWWLWEHRLLTARLPEQSLIQQSLRARAWYAQPEAPRLRSDAAAGRR